MKESDNEKSHKEDGDNYFKKLEIKKKKKFNVKLKEKVPCQSLQEQIIELQKMQLNGFEESEKQQQQFFEQMIEVKPKNGTAEKEKDTQFFM